MAEELDVTTGNRPTREQWLAAVDKVLKGKDFDRTLVTTTLDGIAIQPLYTPDSIGTAHDESGFPGFEPLIRGAHVAPRHDGQWDIRTRITRPEIDRANVQILEDLNNGATSVDLVLDLAGDGSGIGVRDADDLDRVLTDVLLDAAPVSLHAGVYGEVAAGWYRQILAARGIGGADPSGSLGLDPIGALVTGGELPQGFTPALRAAVELVDPGTPRLRAFVASGVPAGDAGASEAQEIGYVLAVGLSYLRALDGLDNAAAQITLEVTADVDVFATVAKLRALRYCWQTICEHLGQPADNTQIVAVSADRWLTDVDPWVNILRGTAATLAAVVGGADTVTISAFDSASGQAGELGRRLSRNTQLLLQDESGIGRVMDPAGGSWYVEWFTEELAQAGWKYFQRIEEAGGPLDALDEIGTDIAVVADRRGERIATRERPITGVSEFPLLDEQRPEPAPPVTADTRPAVPLTGDPTRTTAWPRRRLAEPFEQLRHSADGATIFLANLGPIAVHTARATFAANLFAAGGIRAISDDGHDTAESVAEAFKASGCRIACICSSDDVYAGLAEATAEALKQAGAERVYLAGRGEYPGVDEYVYAGVDALDVLTRAEAAR